MKALCNLPLKEILFSSFVIFFCFNLQAEEKIKMHDGFELTTKITHPISKQKAPFMILIHGSGPQSMDVNLTTITREKKPNLLFKTIAEHLNGKGFSVLRYHKRSYEIKLKLAEDPKFLNSKVVQETQKNPLKFFIEDAKSMVDYLQKNYPESPIYLFGHSQGTYIALQVAHEKKSVQGVLLAGYSSLPLGTIVFEQLVYRPMHTFKQLDQNRNLVLDLEELSDDTPVSVALRSQFSLLDLNQDKRLSNSEFKAGNLANYHNFYRQLRAYAKQELAYPLLEDILKGLSIPVAFFQGEWDNQTPSYYTKSIELLNKVSWKKKNFTFHYFAKLGHALDARENYQDLVYNTLEKKALEAIGRYVEKYIKETEKEQK